MDFDADDETTKNLLVPWKCRGREYMTKVQSTTSSLQITVTDKFTSEKWKCDYDASYIETLTKKTGNFKRFDIFVKMLSAGFLSTKRSISLDYLTYDDVLVLKRKNYGERFWNACNTDQIHCANKRYIILTYNADYDLIHYPIPLIYCGLPQPEVLQRTIHSLESEINHLQEKLKTDKGENEKNKLLEKRAFELVSENKSLKNEVHQLKQKLQQYDAMMPLNSLEVTLQSLKESYVEDSVYFKKAMEELITINSQLVKQNAILKNGRPKNNYETDKYRSPNSDMKINPNIASTSGRENYHRTGNHCTFFQRRGNHTSPRSITSLKRHSHSNSDVPRSSIQKQSYRRKDLSLCSSSSSECIEPVRTNPKERVIGPSKSRTCDINQRLFKGHSNPRNPRKSIKQKRETVHKNTISPEDSDGYDFEDRIERVRKALEKNSWTK